MLLFAIGTTGWTYIFVGITFAIYLVIGWRSRVKEEEGFYVAGQGVPAIANGAATAADWMSAASFISMAGLISTSGYYGSVYLMGWTGGYVLLALLLAPYLRKFGQFTVPDFVGARYYSNVARIVAAICAIFISLTYVAGQMRGVGLVFSRFLEIPITQGVVIGMVIVAFFAVLGGMKGITWTQVSQFFILIVAFLIPAIALSMQLTGTPIPQLGFVTSDIAEKVNQLQLDLGFGEYTKPFATPSENMLNVFCLTFALMAGTAGLPHVIVRFYTVPNVRAARYSAGWALLFIAILYTAAPALAMFARYNLLSTLDQATLTPVPITTNDSGVQNQKIWKLTKEVNGKTKSITWTDAWQQSGLIKFEDKNGDGILQMNATKDPVTGAVNFAEAIIDKDIIVLATPEIAELPPWVIALVATGGLAAALSTAAGLLLVISSSLAHDLYIHFLNPKASEATKIKAGRIMIVGAVVVAGYFGVHPPGFVGEVVAFAFGLAAASFFPIIFLGIFDKRTNREGAIAGMILGLLFTGIYIVGCQFHVIFKDFGATQPLFGHWCFGISPKGIGTVGCLLNFIVTYTVSRMTPAPPAEIQELVENVRVPQGSGTATGH